MSNQQDTFKHDQTFPGSLQSNKHRGIRVRSLAVLPSLLTIGNGIAGMACVIMLFKAYAFLQTAHQTSSQDAWMLANNALFSAAVYIGFGMLLDALDGKIARLTGSEGEFGAELDSLCDAISFCLAPALFLRVFGEALFGSEDSIDPAFLVRTQWAVSALFLACGLLRLARFNIETERDDDHKSFRGLPSPAAAGAALSLFLLSWHFRDQTTGKLAFTESMSFLVPLTGILLALLMVSRIRYPHIINRLLSGSKSIWQIVIVIAFLMILFMLGVEMIPLVLACGFLAYPLLGPMDTLFRLLRIRSRSSLRKKAAR